MSILAFSSVAETLLALQTTSNGPLDFRVFTERRGQAEYLVPEIQALLATHQLPLTALDKIGVVTGPGSFTGLRVGLAAAEGLALALACPLVGIDAFSWWRQAARQQGLTKPSAIVLDTLRDDVFIAVYDGPRTLLEPQVMGLAAARALLDENKVLVLGNAMHLLPDYNFLPLSHATLAEALVHLTVAMPAGNVAPVYLRAPEISQAGASRVARA